MQHAFLVVYRHFRTAHQSHLQWANAKSEVLKMQSTEYVDFCNLISYEAFHPFKSSNLTISSKLLLHTKEDYTYLQYFNFNGSE